MIEVVQEFSS